MSEKSKSVPATTIQTPISLSQITPANLSYIRAGMKPGDSLNIVLNGDNRLVASVSTTGSKIDASSLEHRLAFVLDPQPVKPSWMGLTWDVPEHVHLAVKAKRAAGEKKLKEKTGLKASLKQAFSMALFFMSLEDVVQEVSGSEKLLEFKIGPYQVFTSMEMIPVSYSENGGEIVYL